MNPPKALIFDVGNVLIDIDYDQMVAAFMKIATIDFRDHIGYYHQDSIFDQFERGEISAASFRDRLRPYLIDGVTDTQIDAAWNSILTDYPPARFDMLLKLRNRYHLYALSNINEIHLAHIDAHLRCTFHHPDLSSYFDHAFYSHQMGMRKPEPRIYQDVIAHIGFAPSEVIFIDDKSENTEAAAAQGWQVYHATHRNEVIAWMQQYFTLAF